MEAKGSSAFEKLFSVNVNGHTEKKNGLTYLSWAWAWAELLKRFPDSTYAVYENQQGWCYHTDGKTAWVKTGVTVEGKECIEYLPVMDARNRSIPVANITSFDVNKAIQRSLTKAVARHGLGLYVYAGEDLPEAEEEEKPAPKPNQTKPIDAEAVKQDIIRLAGGDMGFITDTIGKAKPGAKSLDDLTDEQLVKFRAFLEKRR